jgi:(p)ppGpp synthase/HD superfamily hydrolase
MPRGKKKDASETLEQQIQSLQENIETYQRKIAKAKAKKRELEERKKKRDIEALYAALQSSGMSAAELLRVLKNRKEAEKPAGVSPPAEPDSPRR